MQRMAKFGIRGLAGAANATDPDYGDAGAGVGGNHASGGPGRVVVRMTKP